MRQSPLRGVGGVAAPTFSHLYKDEADKYHDSDSFTGAQLLRVVSVDPVERLSIELEHTVPTQPQIAPTVLVDGHDALAR